MICRLLVSLALLLSISPALAQQPDRYPYRIYVTQAQAAVTNLEQNPGVRETAFKDVEINLFSKSESDVPTTFRVLWLRIAAMQMAAIAGYRLFPETTKPAGGWLDRPTWERNARHWRAIVVAASLVPGSRLVLDSEPYAGEMPTVTQAAFRDAAKPFLDAVRETGVVPCIIDARADYPVSEALAWASVSGVELWMEGATFDLANRWPQDKTIARKEILDDEINAGKLQAQLPPGSIRAVRHVVDDDLIRDQGGALRRDIEVLGGHRPWLFLRNRADERFIGTPAWVTRATLSTTNDVKASWFAPPLNSEAIRPFPGTTSLQSLPQAGTWPSLRPDLKSSLGHLLTGGLMLRASDAVPNTSANYHVDIEVMLPTIGQGPILSASQTNREAWNLVFDAASDSVVLEVRVPTTPCSVETFVVMPHPARITPLRFLVSYEGGVFVLQSDMRFTPSKPMLPQAGHLYIGGGTKLCTYEPTYYEGLVFRRLELPADRFPLAFAERVAIVAKGWPR